MPRTTRVASLYCLLLLGACDLPFGGGAPRAAEPVAEPAPIEAPSVDPPLAVAEPTGQAHAVRVRVTRADTGTRTAAVIVLDESPGPDGTLAPAAVSRIGIPETVLHPVLARDVVYAVVLFEDRDGDLRIGREEPVIPLRARATSQPRWNGEAIVLLTPEASFVGQAPWNLDEVWFEPAPAR